MAPGYAVRKGRAIRPFQPMAVGQKRRKPGLTPRSPPIHDASPRRRASSDDPPADSPDRRPIGSTSRPPAKPSHDPCYAAPRRDADGAHRSIDRGPCAATMHGTASWLTPDIHSAADPPQSARLAQCRWHPSAARVPGRSAARSFAAPPRDAAPAIDSAPPHRRRVPVRVAPEFPRNLATWRAISHTLLILRPAFALVSILAQRRRISFRRP